MNNCRVYTGQSFVLSRGNIRQNSTLNFVMFHVIKILMTAIFASRYGSQRTNQCTIRLLPSQRETALAYICIANACFRPCKQHLPSNIRSSFSFSFQTCVFLILYIYIYNLFCRLVFNLQIFIVLCDLVMAVNLLLVYYKSDLVAITVHKLQVLDNHFLVWGCVNFDLLGFPSVTWKQWEWIL